LACAAVLAVASACGDSSATPQKFYVIDTRAPSTATATAPAETYSQPTAEGTATPTDSPSATPSGSKATATAAPTASPTAVPNVATITTKVVTGNGTSTQCGGWKFSFREPVVAGVSGATAINTSIAAKVQAYIDAFKAQLAQGGGAGPCTLDGQFTTGTNSKTVLSLGLTVAEYLGGASSETLVGCLNYGVADGAPIALGDLFTTSTAGAGALSTQSRIQLKTILGPSADVNWINTGTTAVMANFATSWVFLQTGLQITFPQLQVASAAEGTPRIVIAWTALKSVLKSNGPAAPYAG
jgi:hypothetical protein